jgi:hypothetical protein
MRRTSSSPRTRNPSRSATTSDQEPIPDTLRAERGEPPESKAPRVSGPVEIPTIEPPPSGIVRSAEQSQNGFGGLLAGVDDGDPAECAVHRMRQQRVTSLRAPRYGSAAIREARIVSALRSAGYGIPAVREVAATLRQFGGIDETRRILDLRLDQIAARTVALVRAGSDLAAVVDASSGDA